VAILSHLMTDPLAVWDGASLSAKIVTASLCLALLYGIVSVIIRAATTRR
jgi:hypothetical protein